MGAFFLLAALGAGLRYFAGVSLDRPEFPYGMILANILGSALFGFVAALPGLSETFKVLILVGFLGSLTTFSSYAGKAVQYLQSGQVFHFFALFLAVNSLGIIGCWIGFVLARRGM